MNRKWYLLIIGGYLLLDLFEDGMITGWVHFPVFILGLNKMVLGNWIRAKNRVRIEQKNPEIEVSIDLKETMRRIRRKEHHHKHG